MYSGGRHSSQRSPVNIWPGFVDGLASLLLVVVFVLMVFVIAQFFLSAALTGRDEALDRLERRVGELSDLLSLEREANEDLRTNVSQLSSELEDAVGEREDLEDRLQSVRQERDQLREDLRETRAIAEDRAQELEQTYATLEADKDTIEAQLEQLDILRGLRDELHAEVARLETRLAAAQQLAEDRSEELSALEDRLAEAQVTSEERKETVATLQDQLYEARSTLESRQAELAELESTLETQRSRTGELTQALAETEDALEQRGELTREQEARIDLLNRQLSSLRRQVAQLNAALGAAEAQVEAQDVQIANLGERLNAALATRVQQLARYRSEFFGRVREALGDRENVRIVGDRFVFQSEVLFESASAELGPEGQRAIARFAETLKDVMADMPEDLDWILRVDGHTDRRPIQTGRFPSNWELSTARATEVVKFLIDQGIPPHRLTAAGFGEYQPLENAETPQALRRNRRIEFRLTQR